MERNDYKKGMGKYNAIHTVGMSHIDIRVDISEGFNSYMVRQTIDSHSNFYLTRVPLLISTKWMLSDIQRVMYETSGK